MPADFVPILILSTMATGLVIIVTLLAMLIGPRRPTPAKLTPYESGMPPVGPALRRMPVRFYLIATLFILFDIEIIFILPWAVAFRSLLQFGWFVVIEMFVFIGVLLVGLIYVWKKGALEWQ